MLYYFTSPSDFFFTRLTYWLLVEMKRKIIWESSDLGEWRIERKDILFSIAHVNKEVD